MFLYHKLVINIIFVIVLYNQYLVIYNLMFSNYSVLLSFLYLQLLL